MFEGLADHLLRPVSGVPAGQFLGAFALCSVRMTIIMVFMPMFSEFRIPMAIRYAAALAISLPLLPTVDVAIVDPAWAAFDWFLLICKELVVGMVLLLILSLPFWAVDLAGDIIELQRGLGNEAATDPNDLIQAQPTGRVFFLLFLLFIVTGQGFLIIFDLIFQSFVIFPVSQLPDLQRFLEKALDQNLIGTLFDYGTLILLPAMILLLLIDLAIALMSRFAQQMNALQLLLVLKGLLVVVVLPFYVPGLVTMIEPLLEDMAVHLKALAR